MVSSVNPVTDPVTDIVTKTQSRGTAGKLDLRAFQAELLRQQRAARTSGLAQARAKRRRNRHRLRVRQPKIADCNIVDTRTDASKSRLYFELSNGQVVRADRAVDRSMRNFEAHDDGRITFTLLKGRRKAAFKNPLIRAKVVAEVELNAARAEKSAA